MGRDGINLFQAWRFMVETVRLNEETKYSEMCIRTEKIVRDAWTTYWATRQTAATALTKKKETDEKDR